MPSAHLSNTGLSLAQWSRWSPAPFGRVTALVLSALLTAACAESDVGEESSSDDSGRGETNNEDESVDSDDDSRTGGDQGDDRATDGDSATHDNTSDGDDQRDDEKTDAGGGLTDNGEPETGPGEFDSDYATSEDYFSLTDGLRNALPGSPHGSVRIFYSVNLRPLINNDSFTAPEGSVAIKEQDADADGELDVVMVMIKGAEGSNGATRDWVYQRRSPNGALDDEGSPALDFCADCHNGLSETDGLGGFGLRD